MRRAVARFGDGFSVNDDLMMGFRGVYAFGGDNIFNIGFFIDQTSLESSSG